MKKKCEERGQDWETRELLRIVKPIVKQVCRECGDFRSMRVWTTGTPS